MLKDIFNGMELSILRLFYLLGLFMEDFLFGKDMKAYTDIPQSAKLAEILPIESADMFCADVLDMDRTHSYNFHILSTWGCNTFEELKDRENKFVHFIPCWSLAALLDVLPILKRKGYQKAKPQLLYNTAINKWIVDSHVYTTDAYDNPVDACVDMILLLKEKNLI